MFGEFGSARHLSGESSLMYLTGFLTARVEIVRPGGVHGHRHQSRHSELKNFLKS